jgi:sarcosine/dimethylglycine N-methyltransferase
MTSSQVTSQYSTGLSRQRIEEALIGAGKDLSQLGPADLGPLEDFHTLGRIATRQLAELAAIASTDRVLDAGAGIGGTARFVAAQLGCSVTAVDLTEEYCQTARWLNRLVGLDAKISVRQGDITDLPFEDASFDVVTSQHVQMNVADKARVYAEARRVLVRGGRLAHWDIVSGTPGDLGYPLPWADLPDMSHLASASQLRSDIEGAGLTIQHWNDLTGPTAALMQAVISRPAEPLGLHAFVPEFAAKAENLTRGLAAGHLRAIQGVALATG